MFLFTLEPGVEVNGQGPNASQVLLMASTAEVNGYRSAGSLYQGSGYWGTGQDLPQALSDLNVRASPAPCHPRSARDVLGVWLLCSRTQRRRVT